MSKSIKCIVELYLPYRSLLFFMKVCCKYILCKPSILKLLKLAKLLYLYRIKINSVASAILV